MDLSRILYMLSIGTLVFNGFRPLLNTSISDLLFFGALAVAAWMILLRPSAAPSILPIHRFWLPALLFLAGGTLASIEASEPMLSVAVTAKPVLLFSFWFSLGISISRCRRGTVDVVTMLILGGIIASGVGLWDALTGMEVGPWLYNPRSEERLLDPLLYFRTAGRVSGPFGHPNHLGEFTAVVGPLALSRALFVHQTGWFLRPLYLSAYLLMAVVNGLSGSVAGMAGLAVGSAIAIASWLHRAGRLASFVRKLCLLVLLMTTGTLAFLSYFSKTDQASQWVNANLERATLNTGPRRLAAIAESWEKIKARPFRGYGMDEGAGDRAGITDLTSDPVHNPIILSWLAGGLVTFLGACSAYYLAISLAVGGLLRGATQRLRDETLGLAASTLGWVLVDMTQPSIFLRYTWITVVLLTGLSRKGAVNRHRRWLSRGAFQTVRRGAVAVGSTSAAGT